MRKLIALAFAWLALFEAHAVDRITLQVTITNLPVTGNNLSFSAPATKVITWSNLNSISYAQTNTTVNGCATNLFLQLAAYAPWTPRPALQWANTNSFYVIADCGAVVTVTNSGTWATLALDTNDCAKLLGVAIPISAEKFSTTRVYIASSLVKGINDYTTNAFDGIRITNAAALNGTVDRLTNGWYTNAFIDKPWISNGVANATRLTNAIGLNGTVHQLTNGYFTNSILDMALLTNGVNYGNAFSSPGPSYATAAEQFGANASATNDHALAVGPSALAGGLTSISIGYQAKATNNSSIAIGAGAWGFGYLGIAIGGEAQAYKSNTIAIGTAAAADYYNSIAIGTAAEATEVGQIMLGSADVTLVSAYGRIQAGSITNTPITGTNNVSSAWAWTEKTISTLANGNNVLDPGYDCVFIKLKRGPTAAFGLNSIQKGWNGRYLKILNETANALTIYHESGFDSTNVNWIRSTTAGDVVLGTNDIIDVIYSADSSRWYYDAGRTNPVSIANNSITDGHLRDSAALSVIGRSANSTGDPADIAAAANGLGLFRTNSTLGFGKSVFDNNYVANYTPGTLGDGDKVIVHSGSSAVYTNLALSPYTNSYATATVLVPAWAGVAEVQVLVATNDFTLLWSNGVSGKLLSLSIYNNTATNITITHQGGVRFMGGASNTVAAGRELAIAYKRIGTNTSLSFAPQTN